MEKRSPHTLRQAHPEPENDASVQLVLKVGPSYLNPGSFQTLSICTGPFLDSLCSSPTSINLISRALPGGLHLPEWLPSSHRGHQVCTGYPRGLHPAEFSWLTAHLFDLPWPSPFPHCLISPGHGSVMAPVLKNTHAQELDTHRVTFSDSKHMLSFLGFLSSSCFAQENFTWVSKISA